MEAGIEVEHPITVLHLEDSAVDAELVAETLRLSGIEAGVTLVSDEAAYRRALGDGGFDLILLDYQLPQFDGMRALRAARQADPDLPVIIVSGVVGDVEAVDLIKAGATDYVLKTGLGRLPSAVGRALAEHRRSREMRAAAAALDDARAEHRALETEVHHRVRNNLQIMSSLLNLQLRREEDPAGRRALTDATARLQAMAFSHDALYRQPRRAEIDLTRFVEALCANLRTLHETEALKLDIEVVGGFVPIAAEGLPWVGLIVNELMANAVRHGLAGRREGHLAVDVQAVEDGCRIVVADDGPGFPDAVLEGARHGVGLRIMQLLAKNLGGRVELANAGGARVALTFRGDVDG
jgi:two-component sensor histidine kinase/CheY-like chemotaxis protein